MKLIIESILFITSFSNSCLVGLLKIGKKTLFVHDQNGHHHEMLPLCVLDFFTAQQRKGYGRKIFDFMLKVNFFKIDSSVLI
jgi:alpha-tubulin N-acetyltransferase 1